MGKYGSGVSMKSMMEMELKEIENACNKYKMIEEDASVITDAYKEICYQWCTTNAMACYMEDMFVQMFGEDAYTQFCKTIMWNFAPYQTEKLIDTFPWYKENDSDIEEENDSENEIHKE